MQHIEGQPADDAAERMTTRRAGGRLAAFTVGMVAAFFGVAGSAFAGSVNTDECRKSGASSDTVFLRGGDPDPDHYWTTTLHHLRDCPD